MAASFNRRPLQPLFQTRSLRLTATHRLSRCDSVERVVPRRTMPEVSSGRKVSHQLPRPDSSQLLAAGPHRLARFLFSLFLLSLLQCTRPSYYRSEPDRAESISVCDVCQFAMFARLGQSEQTKYDGKIVELKHL